MRARPDVLYAPRMYRARKAKTLEAEQRGASHACTANALNECGGHLTVIVRLHALLLVKVHEYCIYTLATQLVDLMRGLIDRPCPALPSSRKWTGFQLSEGRLRMNERQYTRDSK